MRTYYEVGRFGDYFDDFLCYYSWLAKAEEFLYNLPDFLGFIFSCIVFYPIVLLSFFQYPFWYHQQKSFISQLKNEIRKEVQQLDDKTLLKEYRLQRPAAREYNKELDKERVGRNL